MGYPAREHERAILRSGGGARGTFGSALSLDEAQQLRAAVDQVSMHEEMEDYLLDLVEATRSDARFLRGVSTRGAGALHRAVRALALSRGRSFVVPEDLRELAVPVLAHRVVVRASGEAAVGRDAIQEVLWGLPSPA
jgi:MoxR-like ATPase